ncbi:MAG: polysaccharide biosynthesis protein [Rhodothermales bacterium]|nr:polysaccharide biosynthesis protein [Rhodothermales bacterium]
MSRFRLQEFIATFITQRHESLFAADLENNHDLLNERINDRSVLVIGGAGTIGSSFVKAILRYHPRSLYVVDTNENGLTELTRDLRSSFGLEVPDEYLTYPIDFGGRVFEKVFREKGPFDIVANFAAHKHVRSEKDQYSIEAMIENNIIKAKRLLDLLIPFPPQHFFCVSTDKAANPVNVMGASKKLMEETILAYASDIPITTARFANVAFSNGSLLYGFLERMVKQQPLSAPSDVRRYFVSPEESGQLCLLACVLGQSGDIFFPRLDPEQMKTFADIAVDFLREYAGVKHQECASEEEARAVAASLSEDSSTYPVFFFQTDTSGEKPFEEFYTDTEVVDLTRYRELGIVKNARKGDREPVERLIEELRSLFQEGTASKADVVNVLRQLVPGFDHIETGKSLDQRM